MRPQPGNPGRRVGVYGMGEIGRKIASRVAAFETEVAYFSRSRHAVPYLYVPSLEALAEWCSVLMIAVPSTIQARSATSSARWAQKVGLLLLRSWQPLGGAGSTAGGCASGSPPPCRVPESW